MLGFIFVASKTKIASWYFPICTSWDLLNWEELDDLGQDAIQLQCLLFDSAVVSVQSTCRLWLSSPQPPGNFRIYETMNHSFYAPDWFHVFSFFQDWQSSVFSLILLMVTCCLDEVLGKKWPTWLCWTFHAGITSQKALWCRSDFFFFFITISTILAKHLHYNCIYIIYSSV